MKHLPRPKTISKHWRRAQSIWNVSVIPENILKVWNVYDEASANVEPLKKIFVDDIRDTEKPGNTEYLVEKLAGENMWESQKRQNP